MEISSARPPSATIVLAAKRWTPKEQPTGATMRGELSNATSASHSLCLGFPLSLFIQRLDQGIKSLASASHSKLFPST